MRLASPRPLPAPLWWGRHPTVLTLERVCVSLGRDCMTRAASSTNTPSVLMSPTELESLVDEHVRLQPHEKAACVQRWRDAMVVPLASCASCGVRLPPGLTSCSALGVHNPGVFGDPVGDEGGEVVEAPESWSHLEVSDDMLCDAYPVAATLLKTDVCLLVAAYPSYPVRDGTVGWRAEVCGQRYDKVGNRRSPRHVKLFGHWFDLYGDLVRPIRQLRTVAPPSAAASTSPGAPLMSDYVWFRLDALDVLRMTEPESSAWAAACKRLGQMPLLGADGRESGHVDLSRVRSLYCHPSGGAPYFLHPELVREHVAADGSVDASCTICTHCARDLANGVRPKMNVAHVDYGSLHRLPELEPLSVLEELLLSPIRLYHVVVKVCSVGPSCVSAATRILLPPCSLPRPFACRHVASPFVAGAGGCPWHSGTSVAGGS